MSAPDKDQDRAARPRALVLLSQGWSVRNYAHTGFFAQLARRCEPVAALRVLEPTLVDALRAQGVRCVELPDGQPQGAARLLQSLVSLAHERRREHAPLHINRKRLLRAAAPMRRAAWAVADGAAHVLARTAFDPAARLEARVALGALRNSPSARLLDTERPDVVLATAPFESSDIAVCRLAHAAGIPTAAAVLSWDNPSSKSRMPPLHDRYFVWSRHMAHDLAAAYPEIPTERILVTGTPQFDAHAVPVTSTREEFCRGLDLDASRPIVAYTASTDRLIPGQAWVVERLCDAIDAGELPGRPQLLVRAHPLDDDAAFQTLRDRGVRVMRAWNPLGGDLAPIHPTPRDADLLVATLRHAAVNVNFFSTTTLDAALCNTPVVNVAFATPACEKAGIDVSLYYRYPHYLPVLEEGAVRLAHAAPELVAAVARYLRDAALDREGRQRLVARLCGPTGGAAGRIAEALADLAAARSGPARR